MMRSLLAPHRAAAFALITVAAVSLAACSRENKIVNPVVTGRVTWTNTVRHLFADRSEGTKPTGCTSCHHQGTTLEDLTLYANVSADLPAIQTKISPSGTTNTMNQFLAPDEVTTILNWIADGAPE